MHLLVNVILYFKYSSGCSITLIHLGRRKSLLNLYMYVLCGSTLLITSPATDNYKEARQGNFGPSWCMLNLRCFLFSKCQITICVSYVLQIYDFGLLLSVQYMLCWPLDHMILTQFLFIQFSGPGRCKNVQSLKIENLANGAFGCNIMQEH